MSSDNRVAADKKPKNEKVVDAKVTPVASEPVIHPVPPNRKHEQVEELFNFLKNGSGYLVTLTTISNGKLNHHLLTQDFPEVDMLKSLAAAEKLVVEKLKNL